MIQKINLDNISESDLLKIRIRDLPLRIDNTWLAECVDKLYNELEKKGIRFKPQCYLADEWLAPDQEPVVGIPFFLAHPVLIKLEKQMMLSVEGGTKNWCMQLLRHETGHAVNYAYKLHRKTSWRKFFGSFDQEYKDTYHFRAYSKNFVQHLEDYYAQYHPDEDFAETFAVWLNPDIDWQNQYKSWGALEKLKYVNEVMGHIKDKDPLVKNGRKFWQAKKLTSTLANYYKRKKHTYAEDFLDFHDTNLKRIFCLNTEEDKKQLKAYNLIRKYRKQIIDNVSFWTGEKKYIIDGLVKTLIKRSKDLGLRVKDTEGIVLLKITTYITSLMMNYMYTGRLRGKKSRKY